MPADSSACATSEQSRTRPRPTASRAIHPNGAPRVGVRPGLSHFRSPRRRTPDLAASLQLASPTWRSQRQYPNQPPAPLREQPVETPHLASASLVDVRTSIRVIQVWMRPDYDEGVDGAGTEPACRDHEGG